MARDKLQSMDIVRIRKTKTLAVIDEVSHPSSENSYLGDSYSLVIPKRSKQHAAWYHRDELEYVGNVRKIISEMERAQKYAKMVRSLKKGAPI